VVDTERVALATILREWGRIGCVGFGGPPAHIALLRTLCVTDRGWLAAGEFEDGIAATNLLPGPASTQLAIFCAWRLRGLAGAAVGAIGFICPGLVLILALSAVFLVGTPPVWVRGAAAGAGSAVAAVAVHAAVGLVPASWRRSASHARWVAYLVVGAVAAGLVGPWLVLVLAGCGAVELAARGALPKRLPGLPVLATGAGGLGALAWVAFKVGALSYGGGFVIIPLMRADAVDHYHWLTGARFLDAVALGQVTPGPVVLTVAAVGYAAAGLGGGLLAAFVAFAPSFGLVVAGAPRFGRLRANPGVQAFLDGAGPAAIGAIAGSAVPLGLALAHPWQAAVLAAAAVWLLALRRGPVTALVGSAALGVGAALLGLPVG
jgi:chromate transporter